MSASLCTCLNVTYVAALAPAAPAAPAAPTAPTVPPVPAAAGVAIYTAAIVAPAAAAPMTATPNTARPSATFSTDSTLVYGVIFRGALAVRKRQSVALTVTRTVARIHSSIELWYTWTTSLIKLF